MLLLAFDGATDAFSGLGWFFLVHFDLILLFAWLLLSATFWLVYRLVKGKWWRKG